MPTIDQIRSASESKLQSLLADLDARHRQILRDALRQYGRVQDIPESVWDTIRRDMESEEVAAALLLLIMLSDEWTSDEIDGQGVTPSRSGPQHFAGYAMDAARITSDTAAQTTATLRDRLTRKIEDMRTVGPGRVGELTDAGIDQALDDILTQQRRDTISIDQTTQGLSRGQLGARDRIGGDGAQTADGQSVAIELVWRTELDDRVCTRCAPLEGQPEDVWGLVFPDGPGPEAHPNCRCWLEPRVTVQQNQDAA